jgi:hypothetical protein
LDVVCIVHGKLTVRLSKNSEVALIYISALRLRSWGEILAKNGMREIKDMSMVPLGVYARLALSYQSPGKDEVIYQK